MTNQPPSLPVAKAPKCDYPSMLDAQLEIERLRVTVELYEEENQRQRESIESFVDANYQLSAELTETRATLEGELIEAQAETIESLVDANYQLEAELAETRERCEGEAQELVRQVQAAEAELLDIKALVPTDFGSDEDEDEGQLGDYGIGVQLDVDFDNDEDEGQCPCGCGPIKAGG